MGSQKKKQSFRCPYCYEVHKPEECMIRCNYKILGQVQQCKFGINKNAVGLVTDTPANKKICLSCNNSSVFCPRVNKQVPTEFMDAKSSPLSVALLGAKASGKSNYIGVVVNELEKKMTGVFNCIFNRAASSESEKYYKANYYVPLYQHKHVVDATSQGDIPPLIYPLRFLGKSFLGNQDVIKNIATLTFYDTAGENLDSMEQIDITNRYIYNSNGIILLLDPLQLPKVRKMLEGKVALPSQNTDTTDVLTYIVNTISKNGKTNRGGIIDIPIALVFTKMDILNKYGVLGSDNCMSHESEHMERGVFVQSDFEHVDIEIKGLLDEFLANSNFEQLLKNFKKYAFFGVSALGENPSGSTMNEVPHPRRVLDPLLWLFAQNNYIKTVKD